MTADEFVAASSALSKLERDITEAFKNAMEALEKHNKFKKYDHVLVGGNENDGYQEIRDSLEDPCGTCLGVGVLPVLEHHSGSNLPPGGFYEEGDETRPCPDCKLK